MLLNIVFNVVGRTDDAEGPIFAKGPAPWAIEGDGSDLHDVIDGRSRSDDAPASVFHPG